MSSNKYPVKFHIRQSLAVSSNRYPAKFPILQSLVVSSNRYPVKFHRRQSLVVLGHDRPDMLDVFSRLFLAFTVGLDVLQTDVQNLESREPK